MAKYKSDKEAADALAHLYQNLRQEISKVIVGQNEVVDNLLLSIFSKGHSLLVGVPGLAKTLLISTIADVLDMKFNRIQFTPDLMPGDILGTEMLEIDKETGQRYFKFIKGPIFSNIILADEINRTPPKTQSAMLEAMQENTVTVAGEEYKLELPFFVLATQNPIEQEGTYPLPEAQLDRFMFLIHLNYPSQQEEVDIVKKTTGGEMGKIKKVLNAKEVLYFQQLIRRVPVADNVVNYAVNLVNMTRVGSEVAPEYIKDQISWGAGPRASQYLILGAKAHALLHGKYSPDIEDVKAIALPVLRHRIVTSFHAEAEGITSDDIIVKLMQA